MMLAISRLTSLVMGLDALPMPLKMALVKVAVSLTLALVLMAPGTALPTQLPATAQALFAGALLQTWLAAWSCPGAINVVITTSANKNKGLAKGEKPGPALLNRIGMRNGIRWDANEDARCSFFMLFGSFPVYQSIDDTGFDLEAGRIVLLGCLLRGSEFCIQMLSIIAEAFLRSNEH
jgi:hypothetical protein